MMNSALSDEQMMNDRQSDKKFLMKSYEDSLLVICDKDVINKKFKTIKFNKNFYDGVLADEEEVLKNIEKYLNINVFGNQIVDLLIKKGYVKNFVEIEGIKFAIIVRIRR